MLQAQTSALVEAPAGLVHWRPTADGLWLARRHGHHLGAVERRARRRWIASDADSEPLGGYRTFAEAQAAVLDPDGARRPVRDTAGWGPLLFVGVMTASAAAMLAPWTLLS